MDINELIALVSQGESDTLDFKREPQPQATDIAKVAASFSNSRGGILLYGVDDDGKFVGVEHPDKIQQRLASITQTGCVPPLEGVSFGAVPIGGSRSVVWMNVPRREKGVCFVEQRCYIRIGPTSQPIHNPTKLEAMLLGGSQSISETTRPKRTLPGARLVLGRDSILSDLKSALRNPAVAIIAIEGISGIGKTTLASYFAEDAMGSGFIVAWVECRSETTVDSVKAELVAALDHSGHRQLAAEIKALDGSPRLFAEQMIDLLSAQAVLIVLNDYRINTIAGITDLLRVVEMTCAGPKIVLTSRQRPELLGTYNTSAVHEIHLKNGLDLTSCADYVRLCGIELERSLEEAIWRVTGNGHPKALQLFCSRARRVPVIGLLNSLPIFRDSVRTQWLLPLLEELPEDANTLITALAVFERAVPLDRLIADMQGKDTLGTVLDLLDRFICDLTDDNRVSIHPLIREYLCMLTQSSVARDLNASKFWIGPVDLSTTEGDLSPDAVEDLISAWSHAVRHIELSTLATTLIFRLRRPLMLANRHSQLKMMLDVTKADSPENNQLFLIQKCKILSIWGQLSEVDLLLRSAIPEMQSPVKREAILVYAKALLGMDRASEAVELLTEYRSIFARLIGSTQSARYLNRWIEALLRAGKQPEALAYATKAFKAAIELDDRLQVAFCARLLASCHIVRGNPEQAIIFAKISSDGFETLDNCREEAVSRELYAEAYGQGGAYDLASKELETASLLFAKVEDLKRSYACEQKSRELAKRIL